MLERFDLNFALGTFKSIDCQFGNQEISQIKQIMNIVNQKYCVCFLERVRDLR